MKVSGYCRSYRGDFNWLEYSLKSLAIHGGELMEWVIEVPIHDLEDCKKLVADTLFPTNWRAKVIGCGEVGKTGYEAQQTSKLMADLVCSGEYIMFYDSDCIATKPIGVPAFFIGDRPKLLFSHWHEAGTASVWAPITKEVLKQDPMGEFMRCHPTVYRRRTLSQFRNRIEGIHGKDFLSFMAAQDQFSEFNAVGNFIHWFCPEDYALVRAGENDGYPRPFKQFWSKREDFPKDELEAMVRM